VYAGFRYVTSPIEYASRVELLHLMLYGGVYFVTANLYRSRHRQVAVWVLMAVALAESVYGFWQLARGSNAVLWLTRSLQYDGRAGGTYLCPNHLGGLLAMVLLLLVARAVVDRAPSRSLQKNFLIKLVEVYVAVFALLGLLATQSRGALAAAFVALVVALFWMWRTKAIPPRAFDVALAILVLGAVVALAHPGLRHRLHNWFGLRMDYTFSYDILDVRDPSMSGRAQLNAVTWQIYTAHPWFGTGPGTWLWFHPQYRVPAFTGRTDYAHNDALQLAAEYGTVGVVLALLALGAFGWHALRCARAGEDAEERAWAIGAGTAVLALVVHSFGDFNLHIPVNAFVFASLLGFTAALSHRNERPFHRTVLSRTTRTLMGVAALLWALGILWLSVPVTFAHRLLAAGAEARLDRQLDRAETFCERAVTADPRFPEAHVQLGDAYRARLRGVTDADQRRVWADRAIVEYNRALALNPRHAPALQRLAAVHETLGENDQAVAFHQRALALDPNNGIYWLRLGLFHEKQGRAAEAIVAMEKAVALHEPDAAAHLKRLRAAPTKLR
jgi:O-antigen ligase